MVSMPLHNDLPPLPLDGRRVTVVGLGQSGLAAARFCARRNARVTAIDAAPAERLAPEVQALQTLGVALALGGHAPEALATADLVVLSPGVPHTLPELEAVRRRGVPVVGEIELAAGFVHAPILAITGTNGKTTVTELAGRMLQASGTTVFVGGNIGRPLADFIDSGQKAQWLVLEISSFQLDTAERFHPQVAVALNVTPDHLDRYPDMAGYAAAKLRIFRNQGHEDTAVINAADPYLKQAAASFAARRLCFNGTLAGCAGQARLEGDALTLATPLGPAVQLDLAHFAPSGQHNRENAAAAALACLAAGATADGLQRALNEFRGLPHRLSFVRRVNGVAFYDDSKATNVDATIRALESFQAPVVLILGGRDKGGGYAALAPLVRQRVRALILLGEAAPLIAADLGQLAPTSRAADMGQAVTQAAAAAQPGDVALLAPACSSFDMYASYHERGEDFCRHVQRLP
jgi:UDP-N-acetylmuramoylalanine--D-glutamate ligase